MFRPNIVFVNNRRGYSRSIVFKLSLFACEIEYNFLAYQKPFVSGLKNNFFFQQQK